MRFLTIAMLCLLPLSAMSQTRPTKPVIPCLPLEVAEKKFKEQGFTPFFSGKSNMGRLTYWRNPSSGHIIISTIIEKDDKAAVCLLDALEDVREFGPV